jgi:hypothetical protein
VAVVAALALATVTGAAALAAKGGKPGKPDPDGGSPAIASIECEYANFGRFKHACLLVVKDADGANETALHKETWTDVTQGRRMWGPSWSPDAKKVAFAVTDYEDGSGSGIYTIGIDGKGLTQVTTGGSDPAWSPDGTEIAYVKGGEIRLVDVDGTNDRNLTNTPLVDEAAPTWSGNGAYLAYVTGGDVIVRVLGTGATTNVTAAGALASQLIVHGPNVGGPAWAKTEAKIAVAARVQTGTYPSGEPKYGPADLWVIDLNDPEKALPLARRAIELAPGDGCAWNTLGAVVYRVGEHEAAIEALTRSVELRNGGDAFDWLFLAMARHRQGSEEEARRWYERSLVWLKRNAAGQPPALERLRAEAAELLDRAQGD